MDRKINKKKPDQAPDWLINSLKGLLLFLLCWNLYQHFPDKFVQASVKPKKTKKNYATPYIEEISYSELLSTTQPKVDHYVQWGNKKIFYLDPEWESLEKVDYQVFTKEEFSKIWTDVFTIHYKGHILNPNKVNAVFISPDSTSIICEDIGELNKCFYPTIGEITGDFALWLSFKTEEDKTFFTRIKVIQDTDFQPVANEKANRFWNKLLNEHNHKSIDNLTVVKPVFQTNEYLFKWGKWNRYAHGPRGGRRVKIGINQLQKWTQFQPYLYKDDEFVPFSMWVSFWNSKEWSNQCQTKRELVKAPPILSNECFKDLVKKVAVGDLLSIFIFVKDDFFKTVPKGGLSSLPGFIINDQYVQFNIPVEVVAEDIIPQNSPLKLSTSTFGFQLNSALGDKSIVKMDINDPKNAALKKHYTESESARVVHIPNFKTIRRVITTDDIFIPEEDIEKSLILTEKRFKTETYPEFYDFNILPPLIKFRNLSTVLDKTTYSLNEFQKSNEDFELYIGEEKVKLIQLTLTIAPKEEKASQYITNTLNKFDIIKRLKNLQPETSLYFDKILFERENGEQLVFPLATALHLQ